MSKGKNLFLFWLIYFSSPFSYQFYGIILIK
ncbi:hypothetical protein LLT7_12455 [Lactococcus cremoris subsp. cremoris TIFN7]|nr:hypothetical protein LLT7_12455 [Lactococcus cremoris subsp. cremoris TIFN7]